MRDLLPFFQLFIVLAEIFTLSGCSSKQDGTQPSFDQGMEEVSRPGNRETNEEIPIPIPPLNRSADIVSSAQPLPVPTTTPSSDASSDALSGREQSIGPDPVFPPLESPVPFPTPSWLRSNLGFVRYHSRTWGSYQSTRLRFLEEGEIKGSELINAVQRVSPLLPFPSYAFIAQTDPAAGLASCTDQGRTITQCHEEYLRDSVHRGMGALVLNRIVDHQAMQLFSQDPPANRVEYLWKAILIRNAVNRSIRLRNQPEIPHIAIRRVWTTLPDGTLAFDGLQPRWREVPAMDLVAQLTSDDQWNEMYEWLKEAAGGGYARLTLDWTYTDGGLQRYLDVREPQTRWNPVVLNFERLPPTLADFKALIERKLRPVYFTTLRPRIIGRLLRDRFPNLNLQTLVLSAETERRRLYSALGNSRFTSIQRTFQVLEAEIGGPQSEAYVQLLEPKLQQREIQEIDRICQEHFHKNFDELTEEERAQIRASAPEILLRGALVVPEVLAQAERELHQRSVSASGDLRVALREQSYFLRNLAPPPSGQGVNNRILRKLASGRELFGAFQRMYIRGDSPNSIRLVMIRGQSDTAPQQLPFEDPIVQRMLRSIIFSKFEVFFTRELVFQLFVENPYYARINTCSGENESLSSPQTSSLNPFRPWPCFSWNPRRIAELLFSERLFPGENLREIPQDRPLRSTLSRRMMLNRVMMIEPRFYDLALGILNPEN